VRKLVITDLEPGMKVGRNIYSPSGQLLVRQGTILTRKLIRRLEITGIWSLYIEDGLLPDVTPEDLIRESTRAEAINNLRKVLAAQEETGSSKGLVVDDALLASVEAIIEELLEKPGAVVELADIRAVDDYTFGHSVNVSVLSLLTGIELKLKRRSLVTLGLGAILHDVGKILVPLPILNKPGKLTAEEFEQVKAHTWKGFERLKHSRKFSEVTCRVAIEHHERLDGSGYPGGLKAGEIGQFSRIVAVADVYDALTADRVYRGAMLPHEALEMLSGSGGYLFDYRAIQAFFRHVAAYPMGTIVKLSNGEIAVAVATHPGLPMRPVVRPLFDASWRRIEAPLDLDLSDEPRIAICKVVPENELQEGIRKNSQANQDLL